MLNNKILECYGISKKSSQTSQSWTSQSSRLSNQSWRYSFVIMRCLYNGEYPCGKCPACFANRQRGFMFRLDQERENCSFYFWLTLQYDEDHVPHVEGSSEYCFSKEHCRGFFEKLRKRYKLQGFTFKHFLVSEYGPNGTHRPHYHCLLMVYSDKGLSELYKARKEMREFILEKAWVHGHVTEKSFHGRVLRYLTKYCLKPELLGDKHTMNPFTLISPGIGLSYLTKLGEKRLQKMRDSLDFTVRYGSGKMSLPRYYVDKIFPHGKKDLLSLIPEDESDIDAWSDYNKLQSIRDQFNQLHNTITTQHVNLLVQKGKFEYSEFEKNRNAKFQEFRSKLRLRKDL